MDIKFNREYRYHHMGIPTTEVRPGEKYGEVFGMYISDVDGDFRVQYHRFEENSPIHPLIRTVTHIAIQTDNLNEVMQG